MTISEVTQITNRVEDVDGEEVYILDRSMKSGIEELKKLADAKKNSYILSMLIKDVSFICKNFNFAIVFRKIHIKEEIDCIPCMVYRYQGQWRGDIEESNLGRRRKKGKLIKQQNQKPVLHAGASALLCRASVTVPRKATSTHI